MTPQKQLITHDPPNAYGDCWRTAIACLLDMAPADVPHVNDPQDVGAQGQKSQMWLQERGLCLITCAYSAETLTKRDVLNHVALFHPGIHYLFSGQSRIGCNHVVIAKDATIVWDPQSNRLGYRRSLRRWVLVGQLYRKAVMILHIYIDGRTQAILEREALLLGRTITQLAEAAVDEAALRSVPPHLRLPKEPTLSDVLLSARACYSCGRPITGCFGFCKAGDVLDYMEGRRHTYPRELCGLCGELWLWTADSKLIPNRRPLEGATCTRPLP